MSLSSSLPLFLVQLFILFNLSTQSHHHHHKTNSKLSLSFPLTSTPLSKSSTSIFLSSLTSNTNNKTWLSKSKSNISSSSPPKFNYNDKTSFKYSMALIVSLPIGTPPQSQPMVLDTGSQLSWIQCHRNRSPKLPITPFDPSLSSTFSLLPCNHPVCKPRIPDYTLPTNCDDKRLCHYSYFYADGTFAEGNLVRERFTFPNSRTTPPLILGCASDSGEEEGILGMSQGRLSFVSQAKVPRFSYCVPVRQASDKINPTGTFYLGQNPNARNFKYIGLLTVPGSQRMPNFDPLAYTVGLVAIKIGGNNLEIPASAFRPDAGGSGQTIIDSGTQYTFLVDQAYEKVRAQVVRLAGPKLKKGYVFGGALDMCFDGNPVEIGRLIGDMAFVFGNGVEITIDKGRILDNVEGGVRCVAIGRSDSLNIASNIIGNFHQQNLWVEFDLVHRRVGFGSADCSKSA